MRRKVQLRWIAEAEARSVQEFALVENAASEPQVNVVRATISLIWFVRVRELIPRLAWMIGARRLAPDATRGGPEEFCDTGWERG